ncbi:MAG: DUF3524 domain-containing protein [Candidatus Brocadiaceae bacterium]|nr:DUF3524 domain-containing protein [Candidatus Brocadiaceae bacterium]
MGKVKQLKILALEPYYGGSHKAFLDGWIKFSQHQWTLLNLPPRKWKWRMRHSAITLTNQTAEIIRSGRDWDVLFCSDMLNLAEYKGLAHTRVQKIPSIAYFHENQLTYPIIHKQTMDYHYVFTNMTTALAATEVWFNSSFHRETFFCALQAFLKRMPDFRPLESVENIRSKSKICYPGIHQFPKRKGRHPGPMRITWAARWEYDKNPELLFNALRILKWRNIDFRLSVIGEQFRQIPDVFHSAKQEFSCFIDRWGYQQCRNDYESALLEADVFVSTAEHEFFGISVLEASAAGAFPIVPKKLAYPETLEHDNGNEDFYFDGSVNQLADRLTQLAKRIRNNTLWNGDPTRAIRIAEKFYWQPTARRLDRSLYTVFSQREEDH